MIRLPKTRQLEWAVGYLGHKTNEKMVNWINQLKISWKRWDFSYKWRAVTDRRLASCDKWCSVSDREKHIFCWIQVPASSVNILLLLLRSFESVICGHCLRLWSLFTPVLIVRSKVPNAFCCGLFEAFELSQALPVEVLYPKNLNFWYRRISVELLLYVFGCAGFLSCDAKKLTVEGKNLQLEFIVSWHCYLEPEDSSGNDKMIC